MFDSGSFSTSAFSVLAFDFGSVPDPSPESGGSKGKRRDNRLARRDDQDIIDVVSILLISGFLD